MGYEKIPDACDATLSLPGPAELLRALSIDPGCWSAWSHLGHVMLEQQRYDDAIAAFSNALKLNATHVPALSGLGVTLRRRGLPADALNFFDLALLHEPQNADLRHFRALALLAAGDFRRGFAEYEWRLRMPDRMAHAIRAPHWGGEGFEGRTLLVQDEGGLGDILQFVRYLPMVKARGGRVVLRAPAPLVSLLARMPGVDLVVAGGAALPGFDLVCPIMSLPHLFGTTTDTIPAAAGYLSPDPGTVAAWSARLAADVARLGWTPKLRVGLVWAGGRDPWNPDDTPADPRGSTGLAMLAPLADVSPETMFYSLQIGEASAEAALSPPGMCLVDHAGEIGSFDDAAALISLLDLVIAVDTSTAHLAGALGCPVWVLSRYDQCWRWLIGRTNSPWYDTMRLYVQSAPSDWVSCVARMAADLAGFASIRDKTVPVPSS